MGRRVLGPAAFFLRGAGPAAYAPGMQKTLRRAGPRLSLALLALLASAGMAAAQDVIRTGRTWNGDDAERDRVTREAIAYSNPLPPMAPEADYPLVAWCEALVVGHVRTGESLNFTEPLDVELVELGRAEAARFRQALDAGRSRQTPQTLAEAEAAAAAATAMWTPILSADAETRDRTFGLFFGLPGRCEHAARRIALGITDPPPTLADVGLE